jgi:glycosyltransferase involved in cell wall biosynthesis
MIKNEGRIIERSLRSVENIVDAFCVCDTGSTDNTVEIVKKFLETHKGCITEEKWRDFGHNRTLSFVNAQKYVRETLQWNLTDTYGILLDADMVFIPGKLKEQSLGEIGYSIIQENKGLSYHNCRIVRMDYDWKCIGVTHEYWSGPTTNLPKEVCYIDDKDDGGCKHDKFERDMRLLEKGIVDEPNNVRYMFYLAQTYNSLGRHKESIKMYKKRIAAGGWDEEIWYSHYMIAQNHKALGNIIKFEEWMLRAYEKRKSRAEPLYKLTEHFRLVSQQFKAYEYARMGKAIPYPGDSLFIEKHVYDGLFDYEMSILDYYVHTANGTRSSMTGMLKCPQHIDNILSNLKFYAKPIPDSKVSPILLPKPFGEDFNPSAISVVNYPYANVRYINYRIQPDGSYAMPNGIVETRNAYVNLETSEFTIMKEPRYLFESHIRGLEDLRMSKFNDKYYFTATSYKQFIQDKISIVHGEYDTEQGEFKNYRGIVSPFGQECEKNWVCIPDTDSYIYSWHPFRVGKIKGSEFCVSTTYNTPAFFSRLRGSASPVKVENKWIVLVHFVEYSVPRKYYHCFVELDSKYAPLRISLPFIFCENRIEFCISCIKKDQNTLECFTSLNDSTPRKVTIPISSLEWINFNSTFVYDESISNIVRTQNDITSYWDGGYSRCLLGGSIEQYVQSVMNKYNTNRKFLLHHADGLVSDDEYNRLQNECKHHIALLNEKGYTETNTQYPHSLHGILCSRFFSPENSILLPLDDETLNSGLGYIFSNLNVPSWDNRISKVFWRGGTSGYDRPSIRMKVTDKLHGKSYADVKLTKWGNWENEKDIPEEHFGDRCDMQKHVLYKYILIIDGNCIASNHQWVFGSGAVPIMVTHPSNEYWFKKYLKPMVHYVPIQYDLSDLTEKIEWLISNDDEAKKISENAMQFASEVFSSEFQKRYIDIQISNLLKIEKDWIGDIKSAWIGHRGFAEWLVTQFENPKIVELGVDYGFSTFVFANALKGTNGIIYGIDLFEGDVHAGSRNTYLSVKNNIRLHDLKNIEIIVEDFAKVSQPWSNPLDILHIDGLHTYDAVKSDFTNWSRHVKDDGVILFHDIAVAEFGVKDFFKELSGGHKLFFTHWYGLGIFTKNKTLYDAICSKFNNVQDGKYFNV